jgi:serine protease AprX
MSKNSLPIFFLVISLTCFYGAGTGSCANVITPELEAALGSLPPGEEMSVIVTLSDRANLRSFDDMPRLLRRKGIIKALKDKADLTQRPLKTFLASRRAREVKSLWLVNGLAVTAQADVIRELANLPGIEEIRPDETIRIPEMSYAPLSTSEWNISAIHAPDVWALGFTGAGVVVADMDTGVDLDHPDLGSKWRGGMNSWFDPNGEHDAPYDADGHGTGTLGVMVGGDAGGTAIGVAPGAQWIAVKIFNDKGVASMSAVHEGFQWLLDPDGNPDTDDAPDVVNNSWALDGSLNECVTKFEADVEILRASGIAVVFSAGNSGPYFSSSLSPANYPESFAAGAVDETLSIASFSSRGPSACDSTVFPEVVAPGVHIRTADLTFGGVVPDSYATLNGTSFAAPHVAGAMALLLSASPNLTVSELEFILEESALDLGAAGEDNSYGYGLLDVSAAYQLLLNPVPEISVDPSSFEFPKTKEGSFSIPRLFTVTNRGTENLSIFDIAIMGVHAPEFLKQNDGCSGQTLAPSQTCSLEIVFSPFSGGTKDASLSIPSNDPDDNPVGIALTGEGVEQYRLDVTVESVMTGTGRVVTKSGGIDCGNDCSELYPPGRKVTLRAMSDPGSAFGGWSVNGAPVSSATNPFTVRMGKDKNVTVSFVGPSLTLTSPNNGESWKAGTYKEIKWRYTGRPGAYVKVELIQGEAVVKTIAEKTRRGTDGLGRFLWFVPKKLPEGNDYRIRITSKKNTAYTDTSDLPFTIRR